MGELEVTLGIRKHKFNWMVFVGQIHDALVPGFDAMQAAKMTVFAGCQVFVERKPVPACGIGGGNEEYSVAHVLLEDNVILPPESECVVWGKVDIPKPGLPAVLESLNITEGVTSGSVAIYMDPRVPV